MTALLLTRNVLNIGLSNDSIGVIRDIMHVNNISQPALPKFVLADFSNAREGKTYFPNDS